MNISGKHTVDVVDGVRCVVLEKEATKSRTEFLQALLQHNGYEVHVQKNIAAPAKVSKEGENATAVELEVGETFKVGLSDLSFVVSVMVYSRRLKTLQDEVLLPSYWNQEDMKYDDWYWRYGLGKSEVQPVH